MNNKFYKLPEQKQLRIINAGLKVFGQNDYKKASTEEIAIEAGISKGLLFHYFKNKQEFYQYLFDYSTKVISELVMDDKFNVITDFFELLQYCCQKKCSILLKNPYLTDFIIKYYFSQKEVVSDKNNKVITDFNDSMNDIYLKNINFSKFKDNINPKEIFDMIFYMSDGYLHQMQRTCQEINIDNLINNYTKYCSLLKKIAYKEEFQ